LHSQRSSIMALAAGAWLLHKQLPYYSIFSVSLFPLLSLFSPPFCFFPLLPSLCLLSVTAPHHAPPCLLQAGTSSLFQHHAHLAAGHFAWLVAGWLAGWLAGWQPTIMLSFSCYLVLLYKLILKLVYYT